MRTNPSRTRFLLTIACVALAAPTALRAQVDERDIEIRSTQPGSGALATDFFFEPKVRVSQNLCVAGVCLYSSTDPGFITPAGESPAGDLHPLLSGTQVSLEIIALDAAVSVKVGNSVLDRPGQAARLGTAPGLHNHPAWQITVPQQQRGDFAVSFRLIASGGRYAPSLPHTLTLTNAALVTVTPTATPSPTPTRRPLERGDANCDVRISAADLIALVSLLRSQPGAEPPCGSDANGDGRLDDDDLVSLMRLLFASPGEVASFFQMQSRELHLLRFVAPDR